MIQLCLGGGSFDCCSVGVSLEDAAGYFWDGFDDTTTISNTDAMTYRNKQGGWTQDNSEIKIFFVPI